MSPSRKLASAFAVCACLAFSGVAVANDVTAVPLWMFWKLPRPGSVVIGNACANIQAHPQGNFARNKSCIYHMTTDGNEVVTMTEVWGWGKMDDYAKLYVFNVPVIGAVPLYRYNNDKVQDHFFTINHDEGDNAVAKFGYVAEGICCYVSAAQQSNTVPLWRLFNPESGIHYYTISNLERDALRSNMGYKFEGVEGFVWTSRTTLPAQ